VPFDVLVAQRAGLRGVLVLSGKHGHDRGRPRRFAAAERRQPPTIAPSLAEVVAALD
jgi:ribonucleotide monophosphatase NagD (HAD superfamily)